MKIKLIYLVTLLVFNNVPIKKNLIVSGKLLGCVTIARDFNVYLDQLVLVDGMDTIDIFKYNILHNWSSCGKFGNTCVLIEENFYTFYMTYVGNDELSENCFYRKEKLLTKTDRQEFRDKFYKHGIDDRDSFVGRWKEFSCQLVEYKDELYNIDSILPCNKRRK